MSQTSQAVPHKKGDICVVAIPHGHFSMALNVELGKLEEKEFRNVERAGTVAWHSQKG